MACISALAAESLLKAYWFQCFFPKWILDRPSFICPKVDEILSLLKTNLNQRPYSLDRMIFIIVPQMVIEDHKLNPCTKNKHKDNKHMKQVTVEDV